MAKPLVMHCLDRGIITWFHITHSFQPTTILPHDAFRVIDKMNEVWKEVPEGRANKEHPELSKMSINAAIGSMISRDNTFTYCVRSSTVQDDIDTRNKHMIANDVCFDSIEQRQLHTIESLRPIWEGIMAVEYWRLACALDIIRTVVPQRCVRQCRTDCWLLSTSKAKAKKLTKVLEVQTFQSIAKRRTVIFADTFEYIAPKGLSEEKPFRVMQLGTDAKLDKHALKMECQPLSEKP